MSLGVVFKGPEGIVLAADSRVTLNVRVDSGQEKTVIPSTYDNAIKVLQFQNHQYVGAVTYGLGAIGQKEPICPAKEDRRAKTSSLGVKEMFDGTDCASSSNWLSGSPGFHFSIISEARVQTFEIHEFSITNKTTIDDFSEAPYSLIKRDTIELAGETRQEFMIWDQLSDEAFREFEESI